MSDQHAGCCFSGYRPEKFQIDPHMPGGMYDTMLILLERAVREAIDDGFTRFFTGMSRGFDLWGAETVLRMRHSRPVELFCCLPYEQQAKNWPAAWRSLHEHVLRHADHTCCLSPVYYAGCFHVRNRFMVDASNRLICWHDGTSGGTAHTIAYARKNALEIVNLADGQQSLF